MNKSRVLAALCDCYRATMPEESMALYLRQFEAISDDDFETAAMRHLRTSRFFPTVFELLDIARGLNRDLRRLT